MITEKFRSLMVRKLGQSTLLQLVKIDFQRFDVRGDLRRLFRVRQGLRGHFQLLKRPRTIDNFEYKSVCMLKTPQINFSVAVPGQIYRLLFTFRYFVLRLKKNRANKKFVKTLVQENKKSP